MEKERKLRKDFGEFKIDRNEIVGKRFGGLEVISFERSIYDYYKNKHGEECRVTRHWYNCRCIHCGKIVLRSRDYLLHREPASCGCMRGRKKK